MTNLIPIDYQARLDYVVDLSWQIFIRRFIGKRHPIKVEAPFQHHFANILLNVGELCCISREDVFFVDLEQTLPNVKGRNKRIDIVCSFENAKVSCAIELKFKTEKQGAQDHGRIDAYIDIEAVEIACEMGFSLGRFFMITDSSMYTRSSTRGVGTMFCLHDGYVIPRGQEFSYPSKGRENVKVQFRQSHTLSWHSLEGWHFLEVKI